ncbi:MAG: nucleotidyltransferase family protein [Granulosicoccus sp.]|nr:nucleotidyltransferase family protein [Granulosicoccus sp.]
MTDTPRRAVLLAAGRGARLKPHTDRTPKPLLVHRGKPTLDYLLQSLLEAGVNDIILVAHHLADQIERYADAWSARHSQSVHVIHQSHLFGTAHALHEVIEMQPDFVTEHFVLSATDYLVSREFFGDLLNFHKAHDCDMSISLKSLEESELATRSSVRFADDERIVEVVEKPVAGTAPSSIGANLTFIMPPSIVPYVLEVPISSRGEREIQHAVNAWLEQGGQARGLLQATPIEWSER